MGFVGGDPAAMWAAAADLQRESVEVSSLVEPVIRALTTASAAVGGDPSGALDRCRAAWAPGLDDLSGQVRALGVVLDAAASDVYAAGGGA